MAGERILLVDDTPDNLMLLQIVLEAEGYDVRAAADAEEAMRVMDVFSPQMILMDVQLPGMDGLEFTRLLKADPETADIIVIAVTAYAMTGDRQKALAAGCRDYLPKPIQVDQLPLRVRELLDEADVPS